MMCTASILSIHIRDTVALALLYGGGHVVMPRRAGEGVIGAAEWDGWILHRTAAGTVFLRWPNEYLALARVI